MAPGPENSPAVPLRGGAAPPHAPKKGAGERGHHPGSAAARRAAVERNPRWSSQSAPTPPAHLFIHPSRLQTSGSPRQTRAGGGPWLGSLWFAPVVGCPQRPPAARCDLYDCAFTHADGRHRRQNPTALLAEPTMISPVVAPVRAFCSTT